MLASIGAATCRTHPAPKFPWANRVSAWDSSRTSKVRFSRGSGRSAARTALPPAAYEIVIEAAAGAPSGDSNPLRRHGRTADARVVRQGEGFGHVLVEIEYHQTPCARSAPLPGCVSGFELSRAIGKDCSFFRRGKRALGRCVAVSLEPRCVGWRARVTPPAPGHRKTQAASGVSSGTGAT